MTSSKASRVHQYLQAVAAMGAPETVADFFAPDVIFHEFPNRIVPRGRVSRFADLGAAYEQGRKILTSKEYKVQRVDDFGYNRSDMAIFPFEKWRRILLRQARQAPVRELDYVPPAESRLLREAICLSSAKDSGWLGRSRGAVARKTCFGRRDHRPSRVTRRRRSLNIVIFPNGASAAGAQC